MSNEWYARPVLFVADIDRSVDSYVKQLGFRQHWRTRTGKGDR
jgi:catechol 2,3-dioxygenase-like lactoylglutathione lyase family enzyme